MSLTEVPAIGERIRQERLGRGLTVRGLARDVGVSASMISQIETDKSRPSVSTLYAITNALGISMAELLEPGGRQADGEATVTDAVAAAPLVTAGLTAMLAARGSGAAVQHISRPSDIGGVLGRVPVGAADSSPAGRTVGPVVRPGNREVIVLDSGVTWELLGQLSGVQVDFLLITYQPGGTSSTNGELMRHSGAEYGYLLSGELTLRLGFEEFRLAPGDAVSFASTTPHGYRNAGTVPAVGVWMVMDRD